MAALQAYAMAGKVEGNFLNIEFSDIGLYAVKLYPLGVPVTIVVDDLIPNYRFTDVPLFAKSAEHNSVWPIIMEKALAKAHGNYSRLAGGLGSEGISYLNGSPFEILESHSTTEQGQWDWIKARRENNYLVTAKTKCSGSDRSKYGLVTCHTYSIVEQIELPNGLLLYKISNPWNNENY